MTGLLKRACCVWTHTGDLSASFVGSISVIDPGSDEAQLSSCRWEMWGLVQSAACHKGHNAHRAGRNRNIRWWEREAPAVFPCTSMSSQMSAKLQSRSDSTLFCSLWVSCNNRHLCLYRDLGNVGARPQQSAVTIAEAPHGDRDRHDKRRVKERIPVHLVGETKTELEWPKRGETIQNISSMWSSASDNICW